MQCHQQSPFGPAWPPRTALAQQSRSLSNAKSAEPNWPRAMERTAIKQLRWKTQSLSSPNCVAGLTGVFPASGQEETDIHALGWPTGSISWDLDCCPPFSSFPRPPLVLANLGRDVVPAWALETAPGERVCVCGVEWGVVGGLSASLERGLSPGSAVWSPCPSKTNLKPNTRFGRREKIEQSLLPFSRNGPRDPGSAPLLVFFLFKQTAWLLRSSESH